MQSFLQGYVRRYSFCTFDICFPRLDFFFSYPKPHPLLFDVLYYGCDCRSATMFISVLPYSPYGPGLPYNRSRQGKVAELRQELNSGGKKDKNHSAKKIALKKIVANMTMSNNDMVGLFPDVIACMTIPSLEIKKMCVYQDTWLVRTEC